MSRWPSGLKRCFPTAVDLYARVRVSSRQRGETVARAERWSFCHFRSSIDAISNNFADTLINLRLLEDRIREAGAQRALYPPCMSDHGDDVPQFTEPINPRSIVIKKPKTANPLKKRYQIDAEKLNRIKRNSIKCPRCNTLKKTAPNEHSGIYAIKNFMANVNAHLDASHSHLSEPKKDTVIPDKLYLPGKMPINIGHNSDSEEPSVNSELCQDNEQASSSTNTDFYANASDSERNDNASAKTPQPNNDNNSEAMAEKTANEVGNEEYAEEMETTEDQEQIFVTPRKTVNLARLVEKHTLQNETSTRNRYQPLQDTLHKPSTSSAQQGPTRTSEIPRNTTSASKEKATPTPKKKTPPPIVDQLAELASRTRISALV